ncbi:hypothetical protein [Caldalkalibacillus mannanilyticus]|uniref:hypothetical protein n=1 Tax=Caldalkalibacillus mannanilyticus TaxID=1418 RepID=UPI00046A4141|nr:hypothetical protein [Caldalkalibacillus mannanilyticus]
MDCVNKINELSKKNNVSEEWVQAMSQDDEKRPLISKEPKTIRIGVDFPKIQDALDTIPLFLKHNYRIEIPDGDYSDEDLVIPSYVATNPTSIQGSSLHLKLIGNKTNPGNVLIGSIHVCPTHGVADPFMEGFTICRNTPHMDEGYGIGIMGSSEAAVEHVRFLEGVTTGIGLYSASAKLTGIDVSNTIYGFEVKRKSTAYIYDISGTCKWLISSQGGHVVLTHNRADYTQTLVRYRGFPMETTIVENDNRRTTVGSDIAKIDPREDNRLILPLDRIINGITPDLSGFQLDGKIIGTPTVVTDERNLKWMRFSSSNGECVEIKNDPRLHFTNSFFIKFRVKLNDINKDFSISKGGLWIEYLASTQSWSGYFRGVNVSEKLSLKLDKIEENKEYIVYFFLDKGKLFFGLEFYSESLKGGNKYGDKSMSSRTVQLDVNTQVLNQSNVLRINGNQVGTKKGDVDIRDLVIYGEIPSNIFENGADKYNYEYAPLSVSPFQPKIYSPMEVTSVVGTPSSNPTSSTPSEWMEVMVNGVKKYIPIYS